jgi:aromatic-L-amino-acid decarboxylase
VRLTETFAEQLASDTRDGESVARLVRESLPEAGTNFDALLDLVFGALVEKGYNTAHPGTLSYVTGGGLVHSAIADLIAGVTNRYVAYWGASPGMAELENTAIRWCADIVGMPADSGGLLLSGGSMANLTALTAARRNVLGDDFANGVVYTSDQSHHSVNKAVMLAGFPARALRVVPSDSAFRMRLDVLAELVERDRGAGLRPFFVVATAGSTNTGAVDDLEGLADLCASHELWLHVDAAYGGFFAMTERGKRVLTGIGRADSVVLDPHKSLFLPFGTGCLVVRDLPALQRAHELHSDYIHDATELGDAAGVVNFGDLSAEMSRACRGIRLWLPLKLLGARAFRDALDEKLDLAKLAHRELEASPEFEVVAPPVLSTLAFRPRRPELSGAELDALSRRILANVNRRGRVHLSATRLNGRFTLRICVLSFRTHEEHVRAAIQDLEAALVEEARC